MSRKISFKKKIPVVSKERAFSNLCLYTAVISTMDSSQHKSVSPHRPQAKILSDTPMESTQQHIIALELDQMWMLTLIFARKVIVRSVYTNPK